MFALGSSSVALDNRRLPINFRNALGIEIARRCNMARGVTSDKTRMGHKETALDLITDMPRDMDFCCNGPSADINEGAQRFGKQSVEMTPNTFKN